MEQSTNLDKSSYNPAKYIPPEQQTFYQHAKNTTCIQWSRPKVELGSIIQDSRLFQVTSMVLYHVLPQSRESLSMTQAVLLNNSIGLSIVNSNNKPMQDEKYSTWNTKNYTTS